MGAPQTLPADFFDKQAQKPPDTLPANFFDKQEESPQQTPAEASMFTNLKQGAVGFGKGAMRTIGTTANAIANPSAAMFSPPPEYSKLQPTNAAQRIGGYVETAAELAPGALGLGKAAVGLAEGLPSFAKGAKMFEELKGSIGSIPVDTESVTPIAKEASGMLGHTAPKAITDYLKRIIPKNVEMPFGLSDAPGNPAQIPSRLTYNEARDLYSAVSKLTVKEAQESSGAMAHKVREFASALDDSIRQAIPTMTEQQKYAAAMEEYAKAGTLGRQIDVLKKYGLPLAAGAILARYGSTILKTATGLMGQ